MEFINSKGVCLEAFKREWQELVKSTGSIRATCQDSEREAEFLHSELKAIREQLNYSRRNVDDLVSQQEVLKETIDSINHRRDELVDSEVKNREDIQLYNSYFSELKEALSVGYDWTPDQIEQRILLEKERDFKASKLENNMNQLTGLRSEIEHLYETISENEKEIIQLDESIVEADKRKYELKKLTSSIYGKKSEVEKSIFELRATMVDAETDLTEKQRLRTVEDQSIKTLEQSIAKSKVQMDTYISDYDKLYSVLQEGTLSQEKQNLNNEKYKLEIEEKLKAIDSVTEECKVVAKELKAANELRQLTLQKISEAEQLRRDNEQAVDDLENQIEHLRRVEMTAVGRDIDKQEKELSQLRQKLDLLRKKSFNTEKSSKIMHDLIQLNVNGGINLTMECKVIEEEIMHSKNQIRGLLTEKEKFERDTEIANQQYYTALEELKLQDLQVAELNKKIISDQARLRQKQSLYESVRSDRNLYSKQLIDSQDEIVDLRRKFRSMNHHIDQMKEEISAKDNLIVKEHFLHHSVEKERELLKNELTKIRKQVQSSEVIIENQRVEVMKLQRIIEEADQEASRQKNELATVLSERNLLTSQLVKRNSELSEMYQKVKIQRNNLRLGERNYNQFYVQMKEWRDELREIVFDHNDTMLKLSKIVELRHKEVQLERKLRKERVKSRALLDELDKPMNVHRWRMLESSDPKRYAKVLQVHSLQKHFVEMSDRVVQTQLLGKPDDMIDTHTDLSVRPLTLTSASFSSYSSTVQEKEKVYEELKHVIARHPGPEVEEQIQVYQQTLKDKSRQLAAMDKELGMYREQVSVFKEEIAAIDQSSRRLNKKWIKRMKKTRELK